MASTSAAIYLQLALDAVKWRMCMAASRHHDGMGHGTVTSVQRARLSERGAAVRRPWEGPVPSVLDSRPRAHQRCASVDASPRRPAVCELPVHEAARGVWAVDSAAGRAQKPSAERRSAGAALGTAIACTLPWPWEPAANHAAQPIPQWWAAPLQLFVFG